MRKSILTWVILIIVAIAITIWTIRKIQVASTLGNVQSSQAQWNEESKNQAEDYDLRQTYSKAYHQHLSHGQYNKVIDLCLKELERDQKHKGDIYVDLGQVYNEQTKYDSAIYYYTLAIYFKNLNADAYAKRGWTYNLLNMDDKALSDLFKAAYLDNTYLYSLGIIQEKTKQYDAAIKTYKKQLEIHPDFKDCQDALNEVIEKKKNGL